MNRPLRNVVRPPSSLLRLTGRNGRFRLDASGRNGRRSGRRMDAGMDGEIGGFSNSASPRVGACVGRLRGLVCQPRSARAAVFDYEICKSLKNRLLLNTGQIGSVICPHLARWLPVLHFILALGGSYGG